jgi:hypothetical protein
LRPGSNSLMRSHWSSRKPYRLTVMAIDAKRSLTV